MALIFQFARPTNKQAPEQLILDRRKHDDMIKENENLMKYNRQCDLKNDWERQTDKRIQQNTIKRKVQGLLQANDNHLEDRRDRSVLNYCHPVVLCELSTVI